MSNFDTNPGSNSGDTPEKLYADGMECLEHGAWGEAAATFRKLVLIAPGFRDSEQRLDEAKRNLRKFEDLEDLYRMAKAHLETERWEAAIECLKRLVESDEEYKDAAALLEDAEKQLRLRSLRAKAEARFKEEKWAEAIELLEDAVRLDPADGDSYDKLGQAQTQYRLQSLYQRALGHFREEKWSQAIRDLRTVLGMDPGYPDAAEKLKEAQEQQELADLYTAGVGLLETGKWGEAIDKFMEIIRRAGVYKDVAERLARAQRQQGLDSLLEQGTAHLRRGEWEKALRKFEAIHAVEPDYQGVQARLEEAQRQLHLEELHRRGETSFRAGNWREALEAFEELCGLDPRDGSVIASLEEARRQLELDRLYREGMEHFRRKRWRKARSALEETVLQDPDYREGDAAAKLEIVRENLTRSNPIIEFLRHPILQGVSDVANIVMLLLLVVPVIVGLVVAAYSFIRPALTRRTLESATLCNGDFENGFDCWQHGGELDQSVECDGDECYAVLGNPDYVCEGGVPVGQAWIEQAVEVPQEGSPALYLEYHIFSYDLDLPDYDYFQVAIDGEPLSERYGNYEWNEPSCSGEAWSSGWQTLTLDLSAYRGQEITISLHNINGTQPYYNTWTYVDNVRIGEVG